MLHPPKLLSSDISGKATENHQNPINSTQPSDAIVLVSDKYSSSEIETQNNPKAEPPKKPPTGFWFLASVIENSFIYRKIMVPPVIGVFLGIFIGMVI